MRLARKFTLTFLVGLCLVLVTDTLLRLSRGVERIELGVRRDQAVIGRDLAATIAEVWPVEGEARALDIVRRIDLAEAKIDIQWVRLDADARERRPRAPGDVLAPLARGGEVIWETAGPSATAEVVTYIPVPAPGTLPPTAIELTESLAEVGPFLRASFERIGLTMLAIAAVTGLLAVILGAWIVGRPVRLLIERARRIGQGDLEGRLELRQQDELGELATELDAMCGHLAAANARVAAETSARIAALEQLRHADRLAIVGRLASGIAHELGTPLNVLLERVKVARSGALAEREGAENLRICAEQGERMVKIIRQLLDFARPRGPRKAAEDLRQLARQAVLLVKPLVPKGVPVAFEVDDGEPTLAAVDAAQLQHVLTNLLVNAIQASPRGGKIRVAVRRERARLPGRPDAPEGDGLAVEVSDEGVGIAPENLGRVFEPFFTTKEPGQGTGLGLSVAHGIVREHGGWISVASSPERGSAFTIHLPFEKEAEHAASPRR